MRTSSLEVQLDARQARSGPSRECPRSSPALRATASAFSASRHPRRTSSPASQRRRRRTASAFTQTAPRVCARSAAPPLGYAPCRVASGCPPLSFSSSQLPPAVRRAPPGPPALRARQDLPVLPDRREPPARRERRDPPAQPDLPVRAGPPARPARRARADARTLRPRFPPRPRSSTSSSSSARTSRSTTTSARTRRRRTTRASRRSSRRPGRPPANNLGTPLDPDEGLRCRSASVEPAHREPDRSQHGQRRRCHQSRSVSAPSQAATADMGHNYMPEQAGVRQRSHGPLPGVHRQSGSASAPGRRRSERRRPRPALVMAYFDGNTVSALWNSRRTTR